MAIELNQIWEFPIKEFHPFPRALLGVGAHDIIGVEAARCTAFERHAWHKRTIGDTECLFCGIFVGLRSKERGIVAQCHGKRFILRAREPTQRTREAQVDRF